MTGVLTFMNTLKDIQKFRLDNHSAVVPPDPMPNSEVKYSCADDSVGSPHVKVGHYQIPLFADMAQLVERTLGKGEIGGSTPPISTIILETFNPPVIFCKPLILPKF